MKPHEQVKRKRKHSSLGFWKELGFILATLSGLAFALILSISLLIGLTELFHLWRDFFFK